MGVRFETSEDDPWLMGVLIRCAGSRGGPTAIEQRACEPWRVSARAAASSTALRTATSSDDRRVLVDEVEVAAGNSSWVSTTRPRTAARSPGRPTPTRPRANGTSQTMNCGESTLPSATNASDAPRAPQQRQPARVAARARGEEAHGDERAGQQRA